ncbi:MAG: hypothetical protein ACI4WG_05805 [Erysipelotrichaceae bacterium]
MKKLFVCLLALLLLVGCGNNDTNQEVDLNSVVDTLLASVDTPMYEVTPIDKDSFQYFAFVDYKDSYEAVTADALIGSIAHSVVVINTKDGDGATLAQEVFDNANPQKWICVSAAKTIVMYTDNLVVLVMSNSDTADAIKANFESNYKNGKVLEKTNAE